ncbi:Integral membrane sensor signal transduction histidine kinase (fragment) [Candidatus Sulfopaludibacter sp. SbA3]
MRSRFARLSLLVKILLSTSCAVTLLFAITTFIVLGNVNRTMSDSLKEEVRGSFQAYTSLWKSRQNLLESVSRIVSEMQEVRTVIRTGDKATIEDSAGELWSKISKADAIFLVTEPSGKVLASLGGVTSPSLMQSLAIVRAAAAKYPPHIEDPREVAKLQDSGFFFQNGDPCELYQITITPVYFDSSQGQDLRKILVAGYKVDEATRWTRWWPKSSETPPAATSCSTLQTE